MNKYRVSLGSTECHLNIRFSRHPEKEHYILANPTISFKDTSETRTPAHLILVLDKSSSMRGEALSQLKLSCEALIEKLSPEDKLTIVTFDQRAERIYHDLVGDNTNAINVLRQIRVGHGTSIGHGMICALRSIDADNLRKTTIVLVSDGDDTIRPPIRPSEVVRRYRERLNNAVPMIIALGLGRHYKEETFVEFANEASAIYVHLDGNNELGRQINNVVPYISGTQTVELSYSCCLDETQGTKNFGNVGNNDDRSMLIEMPVESKGVIPLQLDLHIKGMQQQSNLVRFKIYFDPEAIKRLNSDTVAQYVADRFQRISQRQISNVLKVLAFGELLKLLPADEQGPNYAPQIRQIIQNAITVTNESMGSLSPRGISQGVRSVSTTFSCGAFSSSFLSANSN
ncbi:MAG: VWA domain-containing protein, partial [Gammaproteobacteria bacterium]